MCLPFLEIAGIVALGLYSANKAYDLYRDYKDYKDDKSGLCYPHRYKNKCPDCKKKKKKRKKK